MRDFDWHGGTIAADTVVTDNYRNTQNVRRFMTAACGEDFKFDRAFMAWMKDGRPKTMGDAAAEWLKRKN
jgi:ABC-type proline/glycine betaine transport system substrate-binding protein